MAAPIASVASFDLRALCDEIGLRNLGSSRRPAAGPTTAVIRRRQALAGQVGRRYSGPKKAPDFSGAFV